MKTIFALLMACLLWLVPVGAQVKTDREIANLVGPVKKVKTYLIDLSRGTEEGKRRPLQSTTYNPEGNISEKVSYEQTGAITEKLVYTYDAKGRNTGYEEYSAIGDKSLTTPRRHVYTLDEAGRKVQYSVHESNGSVGTRFVYKYDAKGRKTEEEWYGAQGHLGGKSVYAFDERGNQTIQAYYHGDGPLNWKNVSKYDANGNRTEWLQYHGDILRYKIVSSHDAKGRILEEETFEYNAPPNIHTITCPRAWKSYLYL